MKTISIVVAPVNQAPSFTSIPGVVTPGVGQSEIQTVTINGGPSGGTFTLSYTGTVVNPIPAQTTSALQFNDSAANVLAALQALPALGGNVTSVSLSGTTYTITFGNALTNKDVRQITANASLSGGNNPSIAVATTIGGGDFAIVAAEDSPVSLNSTTSAQPTNGAPITSGSSNARIQITDPDALATDLVQVTLSVVKGTITIPTSGVNNGIGSGTIPAGESVVGNGTANVTITSTISRINTTLASANGLVYQAVANYNNTRLNGTVFSPPPPALPVPLPPGDRLTATVNDLGHSGGTPQTSTQTFDISITKINDAPTVAAAIPAQNIAEQTPNTIGPGGTQLPSTVSINPGFAPYGSTFFNDVDFGDTASPDFLALSVVGNTIPANLSATVDAGGFITLTGQGESTVPVTGTVTIRATDSAGAFVEQSFNVTVNPVNDVPTITHNDQIRDDNNGGTTVDNNNDDVGIEDTPLVFCFAGGGINTNRTGNNGGDQSETALTDNRVVIVDNDATSLTVTLSVNNGTLKLVQTTGLTFITGADGTASMKFSGAPADIQAALGTPTTLGTVRAVHWRGGPRRSDVQSQCRFQWCGHAERDRSG